MTDKDFEWFEEKYPGWYNEFGKWWEDYNRLAYPGRNKPIAFEEVGYTYPQRCWTCMTEYAPITVEAKRKILGLNAASLYDIDVPAELRLATPTQDTVEVAAGAKEAVPL